jgi:hypothetical protein
VGGSSGQFSFFKLPTWPKNSVFQRTTWVVSKNAEFYADSKFFVEMGFVKCFFKKLRAKPMRNFA